ncbi:hypothetical protein KP509_35G057400 [Ceratopteris richardii]|uniref:Uncharacterized protein n=1 Tax=Ceratopteris richardii TaxID=49495 RepID=A0A8T2QHJ1_CERRI|nr:hypothetical protein KP509_35G057400 [Ceratopteris richardii]
MMMMRMVLLLYSFTYVSFLLPPLLQRPLPLGISSLLHDMAALLAEIPLPVLAESLLASS